MIPYRQGYILRTDGSTYNAQVPDNVAEEITEDYVPLSFAKEELQAVVNDFEASNANYEKYIGELKDHIVIIKKTYREHYEGILNDFKTKAKEQAAFLKEKKKESDEYHQKQINEQEVTIEDLRDLLVTANNDAKKAYKEIDLLETKVDCSKVLYDVISRVEQASIHHQHSGNMKQLQDQFESKMGKSIEETVNKIKEEDYNEYQKTVEPVISKLKEQLTAERNKVKQLSKELDEAFDELDEYYERHPSDFEGSDSSEDEHSNEDVVGPLKSRSKDKKDSPKGRRASTMARKRANSILQQIDEKYEKDKEDKGDSKKIEKDQSTQEAISADEEVAVDSALIQQSTASAVTIVTTDATNSDEIAAALKEAQDRCAELQSKLEQKDQLVEDLKVTINNMQGSNSVDTMAATSAIGQVDTEIVQSSTKKDDGIAQDKGNNPMSTSALLGRTRTKSTKDDTEEVAANTDELQKANDELQRKVQELEQRLEEARSKMQEQQFRQDPSSAIDELKELIASKNKDLSAAEAAVESSTDSRKRVKETITTWINDFRAENGRDPTKEDKESIKDRFKTLKMETNALDAAKNDVQRLQGELEELNSRLERLMTATVDKSSLMEAESARGSGEVPEALPSTTSVVVAPDEQEIITIDMECQTDSPPEQEQIQEVSGLTIDEMKQKIKDLEETLEKEKPINDEMNEKIKDLEERLEKEQQTLSAKEEELAKKEEMLMEADEAFAEKQEELKNIQRQDHALDELREQHQVEVTALREQIDMLVAQKRSDILKTLKDENERLTKELSENAILMAELRVTSDKNKAKIEELTDRTKAAEAEIKLREESDNAATTDEITDKLKSQVKKQRQEIMNKTAAATSGWNAAADADEKLTIEIEKAYRRGCDETKQKLEQDNSAINKSLEEKDDEITSLLLKCTSAENEKRVIEENMTILQQDMEDLKLYLSDIEDERRAASESGVGDGTMALGAGVAHMQADLEKAIQQLDESNEELVELKEKLEHNQQLLDIANEKVAAYKRAVSGKTSKSADDDGALSTEDKEHCIQLITKAIKDGTVLWKQNKKEQCYDLYLNTCKHIEQKIAHEESLKAIISPAITASIIPEKVSSTIAGLKKSKSAVVLRSALEKFISAIKGSGQGASGLNPVILASLKKELEELKEKELDIGVHVKEEEEEKEVLIIGEDAMEDDPTGHQIVEEKPKPALEDVRASSLLKRAKAAEKEVHELRLKLKDAMAKKFANINPAPTGSKVEKKEITASSKRAEEIQIRRLQRKVETLENQLKGARRGAGGMNRAASFQGKGNTQAEKEFKKQIKDMEAASKKEKLVFEKQLREKDKAFKELLKEKQENEGNQAEIFERAKLAGKLQEEVTGLREKAEELLITTKELEDLKQTHAMVNEQLKKESALRKKYKNDLEDLKGNIRVYARCRPFATYEKERHCEKVVTFIEDTGLKVQTSRGDKEYEFDQVFNMESTQEAVFEDTRRLVESFLDGFNVCLFAYGQTGSGKTHTMTGNPSMPGLTPRAIDEMFRVMGERHHCQFKVTSSFMELYNNQLVDLYWILDNLKSKEKPPALEIRQDSKGIIYVQGAVIKDIDSSEDLMTLFNTGNKERHVGATNMNKESSRSHSVFCIMVESYDTSTKKTTFGKLSLVDLAGSERQDKTGATGERLQEAKAINQSLSALGNVISALTEGRKPPYKDNTLTKLMQDSLGGNAKTLMFVNFSPADYNSDETVSSLNYAARVKKIVNTGAKQEENEEVTRLKAEVKSLQAKLMAEDTQPGHNITAAAQGGGAKV